MAVIVSKWIRVLDNTPTFVEYIESNGAQYLDTDFKPNQDSRMVVTMALSSSELPVRRGLLGTRDALGKNGFALHLNDGGVQFDYNGSAENVDTNLNTNINTYEINKNAFLINGETLHTHASATFSCTYSAYIFAMNNGGVPHSNGKVAAKMYSCQIYDNGTLVRDMWPCYDFKGVACMYDKVGKKYYYNAGTGEFIAGEVV